MREKSKPRESWSQRGQFEGDLIDLSIAILAVFSGTEISFDKDRDSPLEILLNIKVNVNVLLVLSLNQKLVGET